MRLWCLALGVFLGGCAGSGSEEPDVLDADPAVLAMEDQTHALINGERQANALGALAHDASLRLVARRHSEDMVARSFFSHVNPDGDDPFERLADAGISYLAAGENIAWNRGFADPAQTAVDGWMNSAGHRANILSTSFTHAGLGAAEAPDGAWYFTQVFTRPSGSVLLRGWWVLPSVSEAEDQGASSVRVERL